MRLKSYLLIAGVAAATLFGTVPASADETADPRPPADCVGEAAPAQERTGEDGSPCEEESGLTCEDPEAVESGLPCEELGDIASPQEEDPEAAPPRDEGAAEEGRDDQMTDAEREAIEEGRDDQMTDAEREAIEEAQAPTPVPADPTYTG